MTITSIILLMIITTIYSKKTFKYPSFVNKCSSCRHFLPEVNTYHNNKYLTSKCMLYIDNTIHIVEENETIIYNDYMKCSIARSTEELCGPSASQYVKKNK